MFLLLFIVTSLLHTQTAIKAHEIALLHIYLQYTCSNSIQYVNKFFYINTWNSI